MLVHRFQSHGTGVANKNSQNPYAYCIYVCHILQTFDENVYIRIVTQASITWHWSSSRERSNHEFGAMQVYMCVCVCVCVYILIHIAAAVSVQETRDGDDFRG